MDFARVHDVRVCLSERGRLRHQPEAHNRPDKTLSAFWPIHFLFGVVLAAVFPSLAAWSLGRVHPYVCVFRRIRGHALHERVAGLIPDENAAAYGRIRLQPDVVRTAMPPALSCMGGQHAVR